MDDLFILAGQKRLEQVAACYGSKDEIMPIMDEVIPVQAKICPFFKAVGACLLHPAVTDVFI